MASLAGQRVLVTKVTGFLGLPAAEARIERNLPLGRLASAAEAGAAVAFLASPAAELITGAVIPFAGGWA